MTKARKTVNVKAIIEEANEILATSAMDPSFRMGVQRMVETILHSSNNYHGFRYLADYEIPYGERPGIFLNEDGTFSFEHTDKTRVHYFII